MMSAAPPDLIGEQIINMRRQLDEARGDAARMRQLLHRTFDEVDPEDFRDIHGGELYDEIDAALTETPAAPAPNPPPPPLPQGVEEQQLREELRRTWTEWNHLAQTNRCLCDPEDTKAEPCECAGDGNDDGQPTDSGCMHCCARWEADQIERTLKRPSAPQAPATGLADVIRGALFRVLGIGRDEEIALATKTIVADIEYRALASSREGVK